MRTDIPPRHARQGPDWVTDELLVTLEDMLEEVPFQDIFLVVYEGLKQKNVASGGEEMMKLRVYEKLQILVSCGVVKKCGRDYKALPALQDLLAKRKEQHEQRNSHED